jgi:hypothetical protein
MISSAFAMTNAVDLSKSLYIHINLYVTNFRHCEQSLRLRNQKGNDVTRNHLRVRHCELANNPESVDLSTILDCSQALHKRHEAIRKALIYQ